MAYAAVSDVTARAGRFGGAFQVAGKHPDATDIASFLVDVSKEIDAAIRSRGFDPATLDVSVTDALRDLTAYGALTRAYAGLPNPPADPFAEAKSIWDEGLAAIIAGSFPALAELEAGVGGGQGTTAGSFWGDEPTYGMSLTPQERLGLNPFQAPGFEKTQSF